MLWQRIRQSKLYGVRCAVLRPMRKIRTVADRRIEAFCHTLSIISLDQLPLSRLAVSHGLTGEGVMFAEIFEALWYHVSPCGADTGEAPARSGVYAKEPRWTLPKTPTPTQARPCDTTCVASCHTVQSSSMQLLANALIAGSLAALIAGGLSLVYGTLGVFNLALGQMVLIGGYVTWWLHDQANFSLSVSIFGGIGVGAILSWIVFEIFVEPFWRRHRFLPIVTTIALSMILDGLILLFFEERPRAILPGLKKMYDIFGARISLEQIVLIGMTVLLLCAFAVILHTTPLGRRIRAIVQHPHAAMSLGIRVAHLNRFVFMVSGMLAACGGIFLGIDQNLTPILAFPLTIKAYAAIIAGGKGNFWGAILCAYAIALLEQLVIGLPWLGGAYLSAGYQQTVALAVIIMFLLWKPTGIFVRSSRIA